jgi:hypothetical protein
MDEITINELEILLNKFVEDYNNLKGPDILLKLNGLLKSNTVLNNFFRNFIIIDALGSVLTDVLGFKKWCFKKNLDFVKTALEYIELNKPYDVLRKSGLINATAKGKGVFGDDFQMDEMYFCEFYKIPRFGKTRVGQILLHAKQTQNKKYIQVICDEFKDKLVNLLENFDSVCFAPPSTPRQIQFMDILNETIGGNKPRIIATKHFVDLAIQQKTIKNRDDRIENARETIQIKSDEVYKSCLILDDAIGSGSTLNEIARKLRNQNIVKGKIVGVGIVGNLDGYEVINEV